MTPSSSKFSNRLDCERESFHYASLRQKKKGKNEKKRRNELSPDVVRLRVLTIQIPDEN